MSDRKRKLGACEKFKSALKNDKVVDEVQVKQVKRKGKIHVDPKSACLVGHETT